VPRLRPADALLLATLLAVFSCAFFLHVNELARGSIAWVPMHVHAAAGATEFPRVRGFWSEAETTAPELQIGDALLSVGEASLRGSSVLGFFARVYREAAGGLSLPLRYERGGTELETVLQLAPVPYPWRTSLVALSFILIGALAFWRTRGSRPARLFFIAAAAHALHWTDFWGGPPAQTYAAVAAFGLGAIVAGPMTVRVIQAFPDEVARNDRVSALWPWVFALGGLGTMSWAFGVPLPPAFGQPLSLFGTLALIVTCVALLTLNYRRASSAGRRQLRWVMLGFYIGLAPAAVAAGLALLEPALWWLYEACLGLMIVVPIFLFIALVRFNLFDIDRLITATASFSILSILLLGGLLGLVPRLSAALEGAVDPAVSQTLLAFALAALVLPAQRRLESRLSALLFPERSALEGEAQTLHRDLARCDKPEELLALLGSRLAALVRSECAVIYGRTGESFAPVFARGRAVAPAFDGEGPMISALQQSSGALDVTLAGRTGRAVPASPTEQGALEAMGVEIALPLQLEDELAAFVCLGEKRSGDVFTSTDRILLQTLADKAADELRRFNQVEVHRQQRQMNDRLRSYVPGAVADRLASGGEIGEGKREVSVLFVDIRDYTRFSERNTAETIFTVVNRYTEAVSGIVRQEGGAVVEFNGDGMMAVFGAPNSLPRKESAAVRAGQRIVDAVRTLELPQSSDAPSQLEVGVGIATGEAYVGSIRAVDRLIWSALGNTTNLAARLQSLTRSFEAAIAIDGNTRAAARDATAEFEAHPSQHVRGRSQRIDIYTLPLTARPVETRAARSA